MSQKTIEACSLDDLPMILGETPTDFFERLDFFAAHVLSAFILLNPEEGSMADLAEQAYMYAELMMDERKKLFDYVCGNTAISQNRRSQDQ